MQKRKHAARSPGKATGICACGAIEVEIDMPAFWAWHDHSSGTQRAQGCAYATYIGCWKSRVRIRKGAKNLSTFEEPKTHAIRSFCAVCGTPMLYERAPSPKMIKIPRAIFAMRTGREPLYHIGLQEAAEWEYRGEKLVPLKNYPGVMWTRPARKKAQLEPIFESE
ncbi:MAG TPA: GFA family protein [Rhizomicrobium sp.]|nr:GFA family protein [Rhizomicrobium sp.]